MNALILAAGRGRRLWPYTLERPKCLLSLGSQSILAHQLARLARIGVGRVTVVAGFGLEAVRREVRSTTPRGLQVQVLYNPFHESADNLISLWAARPALGEDVLVLNGDNAFHPDVVRLLAEADAVPCRLLVRRQRRYTEDDMKVELDGDALRRVGKTLPADRCGAASVGIMRFAGDGAAALRRVLEDAVRADEALSSYYLDCVQRLADAGVPVRCLDIGDLPWVDIDTPAELHAVCADSHRFEGGTADRAADAVPRQVGGLA